LDSFAWPDLVLLQLPQRNQRRHRRRKSSCQLYPGTRLIAYRLQSMRISRVTLIKSMLCTFSLVRKARPVRLHEYQKNRLPHDIPTLLLVIGTIDIMLRPRRKGEEPAAQSRRILGLLTHPQHKLAN
jgi:hypothetical protein